jgi:2,3-bisphosphoglycerate-dependent phosphoglycerate mutase
MRFYFIRHAQSENNALWDRTGSDKDRKVDPGLTEVGIEQARKVAQFIAEQHDPQNGMSPQVGFGITHIYCSPMYRAMATADPIGKALHLKPRVWVDLHECGGMFLENKVTNEKEPHPGMNRSQMEAQFPWIETSDEIKDDGWWNKSWESEENRPVRARRVLYQLLTLHKNTRDVVAIVSHGAFYMHFIAALLDLERIKPVWFLMNNTGITRVEFYADETTLVFHNFVGHLTPELIS